MAIILNKEKRGIFSSLGKIPAGESDHVPDDEVDALADKFHIKVLKPGETQAKTQTEAKEPAPAAKAPAAKPQAKKTAKKKAVAKKAPAKPAEAPAKPAEEQKDEDWA